MQKNSRTDNRLSASRNSGTLIDDTAVLVLVPVGRFCAYADPRTSVTAHNLWTAAISGGLPSIHGGSAPALHVLRPAQRSLYVTGCMLAKSPKRPPTPEAPTASFPPPRLRLLPGGAKPVPGRDFHPQSTSAFSRRPLLERECYNNHSTIVPHSIMLSIPLAAARSGAQLTMLAEVSRIRTSRSTRRHFRCTTLLPPRSSRSFPIHP